MRLFRYVALIGVILLAVLWTPSGAGAAGGPGASYVALGDSYSSGLGAGSYLDDSGSCRRSARAYPYLWAAAHTPSSFDFEACAGAGTPEVLDRQLGGLGRSTALVSITAGGNDAGFSEVMTACALYSDSSCLDRVGRARSHVDAVLPGRLDRLYSAIRAKAPAARVVVLGYPDFYRLGGSCAGGLAETRRAAIDRAVDEIDTVVARSAARHGFTFADVRPAFAAHAICSSGDWWLHSLTYPIDESYHPTPVGQQRGYLPALAAAA